VRRGRENPLQAMCAIHFKDIRIALTVDFQTNPEDMPLRSALAPREGVCPHPLGPQHICKTVSVGHTEQGQREQVWEPVVG